MEELAAFGKSLGNGEPGVRHTDVKFPTSKGTVTEREKGEGSRA